MFHAIGLRFHCFTMLLNLRTWLVIEDGCDTTDNIIVLYVLTLNFFNNCSTVFLFQVIEVTKHSQLQLQVMFIDLATL